MPILKSLSKKPQKFVRFIEINTCRLVVVLLQLAAFEIETECEM